MRSHINPAAWQWPGRWRDSGFVGMLLLAALYLGITATLALTTDRGFFLNDIVAIIVFVGLAVLLKASGGLSGRGR